MTRRNLSHPVFPMAGCMLAIVLVSAGEAAAQDRPASPLVNRPVRQVRSVCPAPSPATLGTFQPTPYVMVRGDWPTGGGYSPIDIYGDQTLSIYGPISPWRAVAAPVTTYTRGYDGRVYQAPGTSFSNPFLPGLSPVLYPTQGNYYYGPRVNRTPPQWTTGYNWVDQN